MVQYHVVGLLIGNSSFSSVYLKTPLAALSLRLPVPVGAPCQHQLVLVPPVSPCCSRHNSHRPAFGSAAPVKFGQIVKSDQTFENFPKKCEQLSKLSKRQPTAGSHRLAFGNAAPVLLLLKLFPWFDS